MDCLGPDCHRPALMMGKRENPTVSDAWKPYIVHVSVWVLFGASSIKTRYSITCWDTLLRTALLLPGVIKRQQLAVGLFTLLTVSRKRQNVTLLILLNRPVRADGFWQVITNSSSVDTDRNIYLYQYLRAICRAEQSDSSLFSVRLICSDSPFLRSRAAVRRSFLAFSLSMHLRKSEWGWGD